MPAKRFDEEGFDETDEERRLDHNIPELFLQELDGMIESTEEFIGDDGLRADDERIHDLSALLRVRDLYNEVFKEQHDPHSSIGPTV